ncbi:carbamoyl-phosphate synthase, small subunit [Petrotoga mobilis SJ95]|jgi:carbamoyl-phosphate synthase small subunit|uniref:Carbamoyl phosphate synthase small chain n=1 Tax=Petrotoga mobilis (strain DSM 10674 / SJ95) TaxID=403833 RepID=A9BIA1_PETMO|nr:MULTISPECIES: glutamine-hydrolyzing carbamoyl-phosphate synthase small subunit [Petrotoga]ABX32392.1 carbamoyl-phosphate synthase, small subunit [Petrotoga mobilis SJ95]MBL5981588.1 carbamoyl phosphate synthase small subunit [Petrotoga sp. 8T1HF07.NaAc.6.1]PNR92183.1 carbamoyl phosphate synthase small subunit [Petrotoga sp. HWHPT.55.6.3]RPD35845.1 carbamoyl phosphate synthase small subunit [Petrotoga sp. HWH.PT.55.6.1]
MKGFIKLNDSTIFEGEIISKKDFGQGEVVFNTSMTGYEESITDPSYAGEILVMTYPLIGNYGVNLENLQSKRPPIKGLIVKDYCQFPSHHTSQYSLLDYLDQHEVPILSKVDTRALTKKLRIEGSMNGVITTEKDFEVPTSDENLLDSVSTKEIYRIQGNGPKVALIDLGVKKNIVNQLKSEGYDIYVFPYNSTKNDVDKVQPDLVLFSNGPGDPKKAKEAILLAKEFIGEKPLFGICLGHQIISLALGFNTVKMKFGHRGTNHPVMNLLNNKCYITSQNHGYMVEKESVKNKDVIITYINLNDQSIEGIMHKKYPIFTVQFHPEGGPGVHDTTFIFRKIKDLINRN